MTRTIPLAIAALLALGATAAAQTIAAIEPERPALRSEATITGTIVRIGDLIDHAGIVANVPIFRAPDLGSTGTISAARVLDAVRAHALIGLDPGPITDITVTRASRAIAAHEIETAIASALAKEFALGETTDIALKFDQTLRTIHVEPIAKGALRTTQLRFDPRNGRFDASLEIPGNASAKLNFSGVAIVTAEVLTLARPLARGEVIKAADVAIERRPRAGIGADALTDAAKAVGFAARNTINAGRPLRAADLMKPELVQRNESVTIVYEVPGIVLTVRGKAVDSGAEGDMIDVLNVQSKRTVRGTVVGPGRVVAHSMTARVVAASESESPAVSSNARDGAQ
jgi:flagella basal body P-ring formation protein FlgA